MARLMSNSRQAFEQTVAVRWPEKYKFTRFGGEDYCDEVLEGMWQGWQAARAQSKAVNVPDAEPGAWSLHSAEAGRGGE
jgi:hypothetical protein